MKISERLEGTPLEGDPCACLVCRILDYCAETNTDSPSVRDWSKLLSCFNKEIGKPLSVRQIRNIFNKLVDASVISLTSGSGRNRNTISIPEHSNLLADKIEDYKARREKWETHVRKELSVYLKDKTANQEGINAFVNYYGEPDQDYNMNWENRMRKYKRKSFSIHGSWFNWDKKIINKAETPDYEKKSEENKEIKKRIKSQSITLNRKEDLEKAWLQEHGAEEWTDELRKEYFEFCIRNKKELK